MFLSVVQVMILKEMISLTFELIISLHLLSNSKCYHFVMISVVRSLLIKWNILLLTESLVFVILAIVNDCAVNLGAV